MIISPSNLGSLSQIWEWKAQGGTRWRGSSLLPLKGMDTIALVCSQLLCTSVAIPAFEYPAFGAPHSDHLLSFSARESTEENPTFLTEAKQNTNPAKAGTAIFYIIT